MLAFVFLVITTLGAFAQTAPRERMTEVAHECVCTPGLQDRFEEPVRFGFGPFKGQCVNSCKFRRILFPNLAEGKLYGADDDHLVVANILHDGKYWVARIPIRGAREVDVGFERFFYSISHLILRFRFPVEAPVVLFPQTPVQKHPLAARKIYDLVLSAEAVPPKGRSFAMLESSFGRYLLDYRILSIEETYRWMVLEKGHSVKQFRMNIDEPTRERLLRAGLHESFAKSFQSAYRLFTNNCATSVFQFLDREIAYRPSGLDYLGLVPLQSGIPMDSFFGTYYGLGARRLLGERSQLRNLEDEYRLYQGRADGTQAEYQFTY